MGRRATIIGTGLIGASVALALRGLGWSVSGVDADEARAADALAAGVIDAVGLDAAADLVVVAVPGSSVATAVRDALVACPNATVTDVGSVKAPIVAAVPH